MAKPPLWIPHHAHAGDEGAFSIELGTAVAMQKEVHSALQVGWDSEGLSFK